MRIVYDDTMQRTVCEIINNVMINLNHNIKVVTQYEYGMDRVQRSKVKERLNWVLEDYYMEIGNTVTHAHGIGNNCKYPIYYHAENEIQHCADININSGLYGEVYVYITDYNDKRIGKSYELTKHGIAFKR